jgi:C4-dicarboxylate transporter DctM subunit
MLRRLLLDTVIGTSMIMIIVAFSSGFSVFLVGQRIPQLVAETILGITTNPVVVILAVNIMLLIIGMFMEMAPSVVILVPILFPLVVDKLGYNPIHFGIILITNLLIGLVTPPVGICLFMGSRVSGAKVDAIVKEAWPLIGVSMLVLAAVNMFPWLSLYLLQFVSR